IDVQLKRRYNLIPNIVETVKGYATHEESVLIKVTEARSKAINATNIKEQGAAENMLNNALKSMFAVAESYPDLKANENFMQLQNELVDTEDKIQSARRFHNSVVRDFNTMIEQFPSKLVAEMFKFTALDFFELQDEAEREVVKVSFDKKAEAPVAPKAPAAPKAPEAPAQAALPLDTPPAAPKEPPATGV
ncbi:LemA family protein, partial [Candidatus Peregrinibacteria bacterium]|nr:LemA family protein [Candidatus Peregrinibacteria bacterium]